MSESIHSITVVLKEDVGTDDAKRILDALRMVRGVISADGNVADSVTHMAESRARTDLHQKMFDVIYPKSK